MLEAELASARPDMEAIAAWKKKEAEYTKRSEELRLCTDTRDAARAAHDALRKRRLDEFMAGFNAISLKLKECVAKWLLAPRPRALTAAPQDVSDDHARRRRGA